MKVDIKDLLYIYEKEICKNTKNKNKLNRFERNKMENLYDIKGILEGGNYIPGEYNIFIIKEPKYRVIMSENIKDKVINHYVARYILLNKLEKYLDMRNCATRKNMGSSYAFNLLNKYLNELKGSKEVYAIKLDISKYFYNIDHRVLKSLLVDKLDSYEYKLVCSIIDSTNYEYINNKIKLIKDRLYISDIKRINEINDIPLINNNKSLPIGNMTSQFLSIFYLYKLDHYIVNDLKLKYMVRYMDDYIILSNDKSKLTEALSIITYILKEEYKLNINTKKTFIINTKYGFDFLGYIFILKNNKIYINIKSSNYKRRKRNKKNIIYKFNHNLISYSKYFNSMNNYIYGYKYYNGIKNRKIVWL